MFAVNYKNPRPIYEQVKLGLRQLLSDGSIAPGGRLPSVRELAAELCINPNTIQRAYRELEQEGLIVSVAGKGSFAAEDLNCRQAALEPLFAALDEAAARLREAGVDTAELCARIQNGGDRQ